MRDLCVGASIDCEDYNIAQFVCEHFEKVSGQPLTFNANVFVRRLAHGGMSSGIVSVFLVILWKSATN